MYAPHFGLKQEPFSIAPDPRYLFMSEQHREALAHLLYGVNSGGGFVLLTGEIGAGKTTICRCFLEQVPRRCNVAYIFNPKLNADELLRTVCEEFRVPPPATEGGTATAKVYVDALNEFLLKTHAVGQNNVLVIDEAQNLSPEVLEQLRLLTNLETNERKLLQIILIGQPELRTMLAAPALEQLAQRVIARYHLPALEANETLHYIRHRLLVAGLKSSLPFSREAMQRVHELSGGVPRRINLLCDRALLGAYAGRRPRVDRSIVDQAASEVFDRKAESRTRDDTLPRRYLLLGAGALAGALLAGLAVYAWTGRPSHDTSERVAAPAPAAALAAAPSAPAPAPASVPSAIAPAVTIDADPPALAATALSERFGLLWREPTPAWRALAPAWGFDPGDGDPCTQARRQQLHCYRGTGDLRLLRDLQRPAILTLADANGRPVYALIEALDDRRAMLRMAGVPQPVPLGSLQQLWRGEFATLWRTPPGYNDAIVDGQAGATADWVASQLLRVDGVPRPTAGQTRDAALRSMVLAFQRERGLPADGLAGPITLMQLNRAIGVDEPRLAAQ